MFPLFAWVHSSANRRKRISCSSFHTPEYGDIWFCFSTVIDKIAKPLSHPSFMPYWKLDFFSPSCLQNIVWFLFCRDFCCKASLFSSKSELHFNQLVVLPLRNRFLFTEDKSKSIRIQHIELEHCMLFHLRAHTFILHDSSMWPEGFVVCTVSTYKKYKNICLLYRDVSRVLLA